MKKWFAVFISFTISILLSSGAAMANGTITATFIYNGSGVNQPLAGAYAYLHVYPEGPFIAESNFRAAQYILGPSDSNGNFSVSVPAGTYRIMLVRRAPLSNTNTAAQEYGPPKNGDYTWHDAGSPITVTTGAAVNLGTVYASIFSGPITVTGKVTTCNWVYSSSLGTYYCAPGSPAANRFVFATTTPCPFTLRHSIHVEYYCRPYVKYAALAPTDANGSYILHLQNPGTYYIYSANNPGQTGYSRHAAWTLPCGQISGSQYTNHVNPIAVTAGGTFNMNCNWGHP